MMISKSSSFVLVLPGPCSHSVYQALSPPQFKGPEFEASEARNCFGSGGGQIQCLATKSVLYMCMVLLGQYLRDREKSSLSDSMHFMWYGVLKKKKDSDGGGKERFPPLIYCSVKVKRRRGGS